VCVRVRARRGTRETDTVIVRWAQGPMPAPSHAVVLSPYPRHPALPAASTEE